jgi:hypothetical protein
MKNRLAAVSLAVGLAGGALAGLALGITGIAGAATPPTTKAPAASPAPATPGSGAFKSNENAAHEAGESPAREKAEDSGQFPGFSGHSNESASHEATESPAREAQENAGAPAAPPA